MGVVIDESDKSGNVVTTRQISFKKTAKIDSKLEIRFLNFLRDLETYSVMMYNTAASRNVSAYNNWNFTDNSTLWE